MGVRTDWTLRTLLHYEVYILFKSRRKSLWNGVYCFFASDFVRLESYLLLLVFTYSVKYLNIYRTDWHK